MTYREQELELIRQTLEAVKADIIKAIDDTGKRASGRTQASMQVEMGAEGGRLTGRPYFQGLEIGRPGGRVPMGFRAIIRQWIIDKGITVQLVPYKTDRKHKYSVQERSLLLAAGAIAETIRRRGTVLHRSGKRDDVYTTIIRERVAELHSRLANVARVEIENEYDKYTGVRE